MIAILFGLVVAGTALPTGYAVLSGRPMLTGEKNRLRISDSAWVGSGAGMLLAGVAVIAGLWITAVGALAGFVVIAIAAATIWFQRQGGDPLQRSVAPVVVGLLALVYVVFLVAG